MGSTFHYSRTVDVKKVTIPEWIVIALIGIDAIIGVVSGLKGKWFMLALCCALLFILIPVLCSMVFNNFKIIPLNVLLSVGIVGIPCIIIGFNTDAYLLMKYGLCLGIPFLFVLIGVVMSVIGLKYKNKHKRCSISTDAVCVINGNNEKGWEYNVGGQIHFIPEVDLPSVIDSNPGSTVELMVNPDKTEEYCLPDKASGLAFVMGLMFCGVAVFGIFIGLIIASTL